MAFGAGFTRFGVGDMAAAVACVEAPKLPFSATAVDGLCIGLAHTEDIDGDRYKSVKVADLVCRWAWAWSRACPCFTYLKWSTYARVNFQRWDSMYIWPLWRRKDYIYIVPAHQLVPFKWGPT